MRGASISPALDTATPRGKVAGEVDVNDALLFHFEVRKATINSPELLLDALAGVSVVFLEVIHTLAELSRFEHDLLNRGEDAIFKNRPLKTYGADCHAWTNCTCMHSGE